MNENHPLQILKQHFGYDSFWPNQEAIIDCILEKKDAVSIMPTGSGKSIIYQIPAIIFPGLTVVVSPLIALMKDQVESLKANGIQAAFLNSLLTQSEESLIKEDIQKEVLKLLYVAPERLLSTGFLSYLSEQNISLFAIDEAHCISSWGHDFRPEYSKLSILKKQFPDIPLIALTATADKITRDDIVIQLKLKDPEVFVASFNRPNLSLNVLPGRNRFDIILELINKNAGSSGIIYCLSRKSTEELSAKLQQAGVKAGYYHAGMERNARNKAQEDFIKDEIPVICATIAFGMGINKSNVRWVVHYNMPKSIEGFYQEIGRAGRDGIKSDTLMFYSFRDVVMLQKFAEDSGQPEIQLNKLKRIQQYAEATSCRRKVLLSYFNEHKEEDCGNCDVCHNPPNTFDGTLIAQKALSAIFRLKENVATGILIDVLRGSGKREIYERSFHEIKTYGAGREMSFFDWQHYLLQMLHLGLFDIDYKEGQKLKISPVGNKVLFENKKIQLVKSSESHGVLSEKKTFVKKLTKKEILKRDLIEILKKLRKSIADEQNVAAYIIFSDKTIEELAEKRPAFPNEILEISGIGEYKLKAYGKIFLQKIIEFKIERKDRGSTPLYTKQLLDSGKTINEIASIRELNLITIIGHLVTIYEKDSDFDIFKHIPVFEVEKIISYIGKQSSELTHKETFEHFSGQFEYHQIKIAFIRYFRDGGKMND